MKVQNNQELQSSIITPQSDERQEAWHNWGAQMMLLWLCSEPAVSTMAARRRGVNHPAGRIRDLRRLGYRIDTHRTTEISQTGESVTVALYMLRPSKQRSVFELLGEEMAND